MKKTFVLSHDTHLKLFLDECLSPDAVKSLRDFWSPDYKNLEIVHLADYFAKGEGDESWLPKLQKEEGWIVITKDHGRDPKKAKLPDICKELKITHIIISESIITNVEIKHALAITLPKMKICSFLPKGTQVRLNLQSLKENKFPVLTIDGKRIDLWCAQNGITFE